MYRITPAMGPTHERNRSGILHDCGYLYHIRSVGVCTQLIVPYRHQDIYRVFILVASEALSEFQPALLPDYEYGPEHRIS